METEWRKNEGLVKMRERNVKNLINGIEWELKGF